MKVVVVSHACVVPVNQEVYLELARRGHDVTLVMPDRWAHSYSPRPFEPRVHAGFTGKVHLLPTLFAGRPQRHFYRARVSRLLAEEKADVLLIEEEAFSAAGSQWARAARRAGLPYGMQIAENLPHRVPRWARPLTRVNLRHASFVLARSPAAAELATALGAGVAADVWPHVVPSWPGGSGPGDQRSGQTIGYAGRLVPEKGIDVLLGAHRLLGDDVHLVVAGDGPLRSDVERYRSGGASVEICTPSHDEMPSFYERIDLLVLPSLSTPTWTEQFGRVLLEAMWHGVPVVASSSGEIPWVVTTTGGGVLVDEGDSEALATTVRDLLSDEARRRGLGQAGYSAARRDFSAAGGASSLEAILQRVTR